MSNDDDVRRHERRVLSFIAGIIGLEDGGHVILAGGLRGRHPRTEAYLVVRCYDHGDRRRANDRGITFPLWEAGRPTDIDDGDLVMYADEVAAARFDPTACDEIRWV